MTQRPTLRQLEYLVAVAEYKNFSRAADACFVTQSTLSAGLKELERLLDAPLVERTKRVVRMTPLGNEIVARSRELLAQSDDLVNLVKSAGAVLSGEVRLGAIPTIGPFLLPRVLPKLKKAYPDLRLFLKEGQTHQVLDLLARGDLDLALIAFPYPLKGMYAEILGNDPFWLICRPDHSLAAKKSVSAGDLVGEELLLLEDGHCLKDHAMAVCSLGGIERPAEFRATSLETLVLMVEGGLGLTLVPDIAIKSGLLKGKDVCAISLKGGETGRQIGLAWRKSNPRKKDFQLLGTFIRKGLG